MDLLAIGLGDEHLDGCKGVVVGMLVGLLVVVDEEVRGSGN